MSYHYLFFLSKFFLRCLPSARYKAKRRPAARALSRRKSGSSQVQFVIAMLLCSAVIMVSLAIPEKHFHPKRFPPHLKVVGGELRQQAVVEMTSSGNVLAGYDQPYPRVIADNSPQFIHGINIDRSCIAFSNEAVARTVHENGVRYAAPKIIRFVFGVLNSLM